MARYTSFIFTTKSTTVGYSIFRKDELDVSRWKQVSKTSRSDYFCGFKDAFCALSDQKRRVKGCCRTCTAKHGHSRSKRHRSRRKRGSFRSFEGQMFMLGNEDIFVTDLSISSCEEEFLTQYRDFIQSRAYTLLFESAWKATGLSGVPPFMAFSLLIGTSR